MRRLLSTLALFLAFQSTSCGLIDESKSTSPGSRSMTITFSELESGASTVGGKVSNLDDENLRVVVFAQTDRFYIQPTAAEPYTEIQEDGSWQTTTHPWNRLIAMVVDESFVPEAILETHPSLQPGVRASVEFPPTRRVEFSGYEWLTKSGALLGPGPNYFSDSEESVWVSEAGLHLKTREEDGQWNSAEVVLPDSLGYGEYQYTIASALNELDYQVVFSGFVYESLEREIDIEFSYVLADPQGAQYVVQPWHRPGNIMRFAMPSDPVTTHRFTWQPGRISFESWAGEEAEPDSGTTLASWIYSGPDVPPAGNERMRFNLWLFEGLAPVSGNEVVVKSFDFKPISGTECPGEIVGDALADPEVSILGLSPGDSIVQGSANNVDARFQKIVVYAKTLHWFVQPLGSEPLTDICSDGSWATSTHEWERIVVLLVNDFYNAEEMLVAHPSTTEGVLAWDEFPGGCTNVGVIGDLAAAPTVGFDGLNPGDTIVRGQANNVDADFARIVLYARTDAWYVQPYIEDPYTAICSDGSWQNLTGEWNRMLVLLVDDSFEPVATSQSHPSALPGVLAWDEYPNSCTGTGFIGDSGAEPGITITVAQNSNIEGMATNIDNGEVRVVLWAKTNTWYVQPYTAAPFTDICLDGSWGNFTHPWNSMVALLVDSTYDPPNTQSSHPANAPGVLAYDQAWH